MKTYHRKIKYIIVIVIMGVLSLSIAAVSAADIPWQWSSEPGTLPMQFTKIDPAVALADEGAEGYPEIPLEILDFVPSEEGNLIPAGARLNATEPQPDKDGYIGPIPESLDRDLAPSEDYQPQVKMDRSSLTTEPQLDDNDGAAIMTEAGLEWSSIFYYFHASGYALRPRASSVDWATGNAGCIYLASGSSSVVLNVHLDIPNGSRIDYLRLFYYDTSPSTSTAWVTRYDDEGGFEDVTTASSVSNTGYGTTLSDFVDHIVDSTYHSYVLNWRPNVIGSTMQLCGLRVAYRLP